MKRENKWLIGKVVIVVAMLALLLFKRMDSEAVTISISIIIGIAIILFLRFRNPEKYKVDERLEKLSGKATAWSWLITFIVVIVLYWLNYLNYLILDGTIVITTIFWLMVASLVLFRFFFIRRGE